jgi:hypothetical protein
MKAKASTHCNRLAQAQVCLWHLADNPTAPAFVRYWTKADKAGFGPGTACPLLAHFADAR